MTTLFVYGLLFLCATQFFDIPQVSSYTYQQCPKWWIEQGCRIDYHRDLTFVFDDRKPNATVQIDWDNVAGYEYDLACRCRAAAIAQQRHWFAVEKAGVCFTGVGTFAEYLQNYTLAAQERCVGPLEHNVTIISQEDGEICVGGYFRAYFYEITNAGAAAPQAAPEEEEEEEEVVQCQQSSDVALLVDVSSSVSNDDLKHVKDFLKKFLEAYDFSNGNSRLGIITFDENCYVKLTWENSASMSLSDIQEVINGLTTTGGSTMANVALTCARENIIENSQRAGVPKTVIIMTDGESWNGEQLLEAPSDQLRAIGCTLLAIGIGSDVSPTQLNKITEDNNKIIFLTSFINLFNHAANYVNQLVTKSGCSSS